MTQAYEIVLFFKGPRWKHRSETHHVMANDPEEAIDSALRTFGRHFVREAHQVLNDPLKFEPGIKDAIQHLDGVKAFERHYPEGPIGLQTKLVVDFDAATTKVKAIEAF